MAGDLQQHAYMSSAQKMFLQRIMLKLFAVSAQGNRACIMTEAALVAANSWLVEVKVGLVGIILVTPTPFLSLGQKIIRNFQNLKKCVSSLLVEAR